MRDGRWEMGGERWAARNPVQAAFLPLEKAKPFVPARLGSKGPLPLA